MIYSSLEDRDDQVHIFLVKLKFFRIDVCWGESFIKMRSHCVCSNKEAHLTRKKKQRSTPSFEAWSLYTTLKFGANIFQ
jgi:hypothetical protein